MVGLQKDSSAQKNVSLHTKIMIISGLEANVAYRIILPVGHWPDGGYIIIMDTLMGTKL